MVFETLAASFLIMLMSLSGKLVTWRGAGVFVERNLHFFVSFAAGVMLIIAWNLMGEIVEHTGSMLAGLPWIAFGAVAVLVAFRYVPQFHHHHEKNSHAHLLIDVNRVLVSDSIHNIGDGIVIVVSFSASPILGLASTLSIAAHEMLQEISEFFLYREAGLPAKTALIMNFISSSTILIGTFGALFLLDRFASLEIPLLGLSVGSYLVVVFHDLIPHSLSSVMERSHYAKHLLYFCVGIALMALLIAYLPHAEPGATDRSEITSASTIAMLGADAHGVFLK